MDEILHQCWTKATTAEGDDVRRSLSWVTARRARLRVTRHALVCGDWTIPYQEIQEAVLFSIYSIFIPGYVLRVKTKDVTYQFGLNWGRFWQGELPFPVRRERRRLQHSVFSVAVRIMILALLAYWLWESLG